MASKRLVILIMVLCLEYLAGARKSRAMNVRRQLEYLENLIQRNTFELRQRIFDIEDQLNTTRTTETTVETAETVGTKEEYINMRNEISSCTDRVNALAHGFSVAKRNSLERSRKYVEQSQASAALSQSNFARIESRLAAIESTLEDFKMTMNQTISEFLETSNTKKVSCPLNGFEWQTSCYVLNVAKLNWTAAVDDCKMRGGHLAILETEEEMRFVLPKLGENTWIGGHGTETEGKWTWIGEDTEIQFLLWEPGQPNGTGDCMEAYKGQLNDERCKATNYYACEYDI